MRLKDRVAIAAVGAGPGEGMGNGRVTALTFAREGAKVLCVDHHLASAHAFVKRRRTRPPASTPTHQRQLGPNRPGSLLLR